MRVLPRRSENTVPMAIVFTIGVLTVGTLPAFGLVGKILTVLSVVLFGTLIVYADRMNPVGGSDHAQ